MNDREDDVKATTMRKGKYDYTEVYKEARRRDMKRQGNIYVTTSIPEPDIYPFPL